LCERLIAFVLPPPPTKITNMKLPLVKASSIISEEDKDNKSSSSNSSFSEIPETGKES